MKTAKLVKAFTLVVAMLFLSPNPAAAGVGLHLGIQSGSHSSTHFGINISHGGYYGNHYYGRSGHYGRHSYRHYGHQNHSYYGYGRHKYGYGKRHYYRPHSSYSYRYYYGYPRYNPYGYSYQVRHAGYGYVQTDVTPGHAEVYINGKYYGTAAEFNGSERYEDSTEGKIALTPGSYRVELRAAGYENHTYKVEVLQERTIVIVHDLDVD